MIQADTQNYTGICSVYKINNRNNHISFRLHRGKVSTQGIIK